VRSQYVKEVKARVDEVVPGEVQVVDRYEKLTDMPELAVECAGHAAVAEAAVIGVPDDTWGERVHAVIVLALGGALRRTAAAAKEFAAPAPERPVPSV